MRLFTTEGTYLVFETPMAVEVDPAGATVTTNDEGFFVTRHLVYDEPGLTDKYSCFQVTEHLSPGGQYQLVEKRFLKHVAIGDFPRGEHY